MPRLRRYLAAAGVAVAATALAVPILDAPSEARADELEPPQILCTSGSYSESGYEPCTEAAKGHYAYGNGATSQEPCSVGTYAPETGLSVCLPAFPGYFVALTGAEAQTPCEAGTFNPSIGAIECLPTEPGTYSGAGAATATPCEPGTYAPTAKSTSCLEAEPGSFVAARGSSAQTPCPAGETSGRGATHCEPVAPSGGGGGRTGSPPSGPSGSRPHAGPAPAPAPSVRYAILARRLSFRVSCAAGGRACFFAASGRLSLPGARRPVHLRRVAINLPPGATRVVHLRARGAALRALRAYYQRRHRGRAPRVLLRARTGAGRRAMRTRSFRVALRPSVLSQA